MTRGTDPTSPPLPVCVPGTEQLPGEEEGLVYATQDAVNFSAITGDLDAQSGDPYCGEDLTTVATTVLETGVDNVVSQAAT